MNNEVLKPQAQAKSSEKGPKFSNEAVELQVLTAVPIKRIDTTTLISADAKIDERSAIDQFFEVMRTLNLMPIRTVVTNSSSASDEHSARPEPLDPRNAIDSPDGTEASDGTDVNVITDELFDDLLAVDDERLTSDIDEGDLTAEEALPQLDSDPSSPGVIEIKLEPKLRHASLEDLPNTDAKSAFQPSSSEMATQLNNLVLLGYISAVESYLRCLTRQLVIADEHTQDKVASQKISFGAAMHSEQRLLPEAFLEEMTFITSESITNLIKDVIGVSASGLTNELTEYERICQLRHCIVHRFGRLGPKNAIKLGIRTHAALFEKPIKISTGSLEEISHTLLNVVKAINNRIYSQVLERSARVSLTWTWDEGHDRAAFAKIHDIFSSKTSSATASSIDDDYAAFRNKCKATSASNVHYHRNQKATPPK